jgi:hypothetical protein
MFSVKKRNAVDVTIVTKLVNYTGKNPKVKLGY